MHAIIKRMDISQTVSFGIIGGGALGGALGGRLTSAGAAVQYWDVNPDLRTSSSLDALVASSEIILICTPSVTNRIIARSIAQVITEGPGPSVLSLAKGVEPDFLTMDVILKAELGDRFVTGIISGPMLASEVAAGHTAGATVATTDPQTTGEIAGHFAAAGFITDISSDPGGVARTGVIKNVFALALGLSDGLELGFNFKSALTVKALHDFTALLKQLGSDPALAYSMAGIGDLLTTGWSGKSFNWKAGKDWAEGSREAKGEGINALRELVNIIEIHKYPVIQALDAIYLHDANPRTITSVLSETQII